MVFCFGDFRLDPETYTLDGPDGSIHLEPQVFDVVTYLIRHRERVVPKDELLDEIWESRFVSESALTSRIKAARSALGDSGRAQHTIRTAHGRGYQFVAPVTEIDGAGSTDGPTTEAGPPPPVSGSRLPPIHDQLRGRQNELADLSALTDEHRLVTVLGPGGTGKTRLSVELAQLLQTTRRAVFVDLAAVRDDHALGLALASALGIESGQHADVIDACCEYLRARPHLLIVDNCEHVNVAAALLTQRILDGTTSTTVVATSRIPLGLRAESLYRLSPLPVLVKTDELTPELASQNPAVALFLDRVRNVQHDFPFDESTCNPVIDLCRALDGLPLALELAAGRMNVFSVDDVLRRLDRRLDLLGDDRGEADGRHRTLRATLEWSYDLLDDDGRLLLRFMAVFPAGLTLEGAEWLAERLGLTGDPLAVLSDLVEASLLNRTFPPSGARYDQLETMRTFGLDRLDHEGESARARDLAAEWALRVADQVLQEERSPAEPHWHDLVRQELPNLREARNHLTTAGRHDELVQISVGLNEWSRLRDLSELWTWCDELVDLSPGFEPELRATSRVLAAQGAWRRGRIDEAADLAERSLTEATDTWTIARAKSALGVTNLFGGDLDAAARYWDERAALDGYFIDRANSALCRAYGGDIDAARDQMVEIRRLAGESGWPTAIAWADYISGEIESTAGSGQQIPWLESALRIAEEIGSSFTIGVAGLTLCNAVVARGDVREAATRYRDLIAHWLRSGTWTQQWTTLRHAATLLADQDPDLTLTIIAAAESDPYSPQQLNDDSAQATARLRADLVERIGSDRAALIEDAPIDRSELAERTRAALAHVAVTSAAPK